MSQLGTLRSAESQLKSAEGTIGTLMVRLEDLFFRAQRIAKAHKSREAQRDTTFGADLSDVRKACRAFVPAAEGLLPAVRGLLRLSPEKADKDEADCAMSIANAGARLPQSMTRLHELAMQVHHQIPDAEIKANAWYLAQECEALVGVLRGVADGGNRVRRLLGGA